MLVALAGLPGSGKSTLATLLARELDAVVLNKDEVRAVLFPPPVLDFSPEQNDLAMRAIYAAAAHILGTSPARAVILDGRTFLRTYQIRDLLDLGATVGQAPRLLECVCTDEIARERLERDLARGGHPAGNRTFALYCAMKAAAEPIGPPHLTLDTGKLSPADCVARGLAYLRSG